MSDVSNKMQSTDLPGYLQYMSDQVQPADLPGYLQHLPDSMQSEYLPDVPDKLQSANVRHLPDGLLRYMPNEQSPRLYLRASLRRAVGISKGCRFPARLAVPDSTRVQPARRGRSQGLTKILVLGYDFVLCLLYVCFWVGSISAVKTV